MRIAIRADASKSIGTGHVMRQIALAQYLLSQNHEVILFASITGPDWLRKYVESQSGLVWVEVEEGNFSAEPLLAGGAPDALVLDAYTLNQKALQLLEKAIPTVAVIVDGPWQDLSGKLAIAPTLDRNPSWADKYQERFEEFHYGPEFFMLRREVLELKEERLKRDPILEPRIVVALGGSNIGGKTERIVEILAGAFPSAEIDAYVPGGLPSVASVASGLEAQVRVAFLVPGTDFLHKLGLADVAVVGAGTTVAEVLFLQIPAIFVVVASNQMENYHFIQKSKDGIALIADGPGFSRSLVLGVKKLRSSTSNLHIRTAMAAPLIDALGTRRVCDVIFGMCESSTAI